jgi:hypothetical protein
VFRREGKMDSTWGLDSIHKFIWCWETGRIVVQSQPRQKVCETLSQKNPSQKRAGGVAQGVGPDFKHQYRKNTYIYRGKVKGIRRKSHICFKLTPCHQDVSSYMYLWNSLKFPN